MAWFKILKKISLWNAVSFLVYPPRVFPNRPLFTEKNEKDTIGFQINEDVTEEKGFLHDFLSEIRI
jgi:hypothetical protein